MLVVDASAAVHACLAADGFALFGGADLAAPPLLWSEVSSVIHELRWRREISDRLAAAAFAALLGAPVARRAPQRLRREAWRIADQLGWATTYDIVVPLGCNRPVRDPPAPEHNLLGPFHEHLVTQACAHQNPTAVVGVVRADPALRVSSLGVRGGVGASAGRPRRPPSAPGAG